MISFKDFLTESKSAPLYHGTSLFHLLNILRRNVLETRQSHGGHRLANGTKTISLTRSLSVAINWRAVIDPLGAAVLELDQQKLAQSYKIYPVEIEYLWARQLSPQQEKTYVQKSSKLYEEYVTKDIDPLDKYLQHIIITKNMHNKSIDEAWRKPEVKLFLEHPKLKVIDKKPKSERDF